MFNIKRLTIAALTGIFTVASLSVIPAEARGNQAALNALAMQMYAQQQANAQQQAVANQQLIAQQQAYQQQVIAQQQANFQAAVQQQALAQQVAYSNPYVNPYTNPYYAGYQNYGIAAPIHRTINHVRCEVHRFFR